MINGQSKKDTEAKKESTVTLRKDRVIYITVTPMTTGKEIEELVAKIRRMIEKLSGKPRIFVNMEGYYTGTLRSSQGRKKAAEECKSLAKNPGFEKAAIFVKNTVMRTITSFVIIASRVKNIKIFKTEEEGLKWLKKL